MVSEVGYLRKNIWKKKSTLYIFEGKINALHTRNFEKKKKRFLHRLVSRFFFEIVLKLKEVSMPIYRHLQKCLCHGMLRAIGGNLNVIF